MQPPPSHLTIDRRHRGPRTSGNGGWTAGALAELLVAARGTGPVRVRLSAPPPLDRPLPLEVTPDEVVLRAPDGAVVASAVPGELTSELVPPVELAEAELAHARYVDAAAHPFPGCFVCGPGRTSGDGMLLAPGLVEPGRTACVWRPDASVVDEDGRVPARMVWAALDCPGGWTSDLLGRPMVLGTMTAEVLGSPVAGDPYVVVGRLDRTDERRAWTSTAVWSVDGTLVGRAEAVWFTVDPEVFQRLAG